jgi:hypothetical protein
MRVLGFYCKKVARKRDIEKKKKKKKKKKKTSIEKIPKTPMQNSLLWAILNLSRACL